MSLRVLICCSANLNRSGGTPIRARLLTQGIHEAGATVAVIALGVPDVFRDKDIPFYPWTDHQSRTETIMMVGRDFKPDILLGITEGYADSVATASNMLGCPYVFDIHGIGIFEILELGAGFGPRLPRLRQSLCWLNAMRGADALFVLCPTLFPIVRRFNRRTISVPGAVDLQHFSPQGSRVELGDPNRIQVLYAGNFLVWQGCELLLQAADIILSEDLPYDFTFIGLFGRNDDLLHKWRKWIAAGHLRFIDTIEYDSIPVYLRSADILTIPRPFMLSTYFAFPNKLGDYMASGRAVLATNLKPHRYAIQDGKTGVLCQPTPFSIAEGLSRLQDPVLRQVTGENARLWAEQHYSAEQVSQIVYTVLQEIKAMRKIETR